MAELGAEPDARSASRVFVVHGRNARVRDGVFAFLRELGLEPIEWHQAVAATGQGAPFIGDIVRTGLEMAHAAVVLFTPDEVAYLRPDLGNGVDDPDTNPAMQSRPNVLFEAGMALAMVPDRTILVEIGQVRLFTDISGRHTIRLGNDEGSRQQLALRLEGAGLPVSWDADWRHAGDLTPPEPHGLGLPMGRRALRTPAARTPVLTAAFHPDGNRSRFEIVNRGHEPVYNVNVEFPEGATSVIANGELPVEKLPAGHRVKLIAFTSWGTPARFDCELTATLADGTEVREEAFIDTRG